MNINYCKDNQPPKFTKGYSPFLLRGIKSNRLLIQKSLSSFDLLYDNKPSNYRWEASDKSWSSFDHPWIDLYLCYYYSLWLW